MDVISVLNVDTELSTIHFTDVISNSNKQNIAKKYILSDVDEELLVLIKFKQTTNLNTIKLYALNDNEIGDDEDVSTPKQVHIYKLQNLDVDFEDVKALKPDKSICCSKKKLPKGQVINLKKPFKCAATFAKIQYLAIYIQSNQNNTEKTAINSVTFNINSSAQKASDSGSHKVPDNKPLDLSDFVASMNDMAANLQAIHDPQSSNCDKPTNECPQIIRLQNIMKEYEDNKTNCDEYNERAVSILDNFNHLLTFHNRDDEQFYALYQLFGGHCSATQCKEIKRNYRNRTAAHEIHNDPYELLCIRDIFSRIHCHIRHQYDIGCRFEKNEIQQNEIKDFEPEQKVNVVSDYLRQDNTLIQMRNILQKRRAEFQHVTNKINSKFTSNLNQVLTQKPQQNDHKRYSYSFPFFYKDKLKNLTMGRNDGYRYCDLYVPAYYAPFKAEITSNPICRIGMFNWKVLMNKAQQLSRTKNAKMCKSLTGMLYVPQLHHEARHPINFGYPDGQPITVNHLLALRLYCGYDQFQKQFSKTYRKENETETLPDVIKRHSFLRHTAKYLKEAVEVFGTVYSFGAISKVYHGVNKQMIIDSTSANIFGPLSTTCEWSVAVTFSNYTGMILEFVPANVQKYFVCNWVSPFPNEAELFLVGGLGLLAIINIINSAAYVYEPYIKACRIIETAADGRFLSDDTDLVGKIMRQGTLDVSKLKLSPLRREEKKLCLIMICHQLARNGYKDNSKPQIKLYPKMIGDEYIDELLNNICNNVIVIQINMKVMDVDILKQCNIAGQGGRFLKSVFCASGYEGINLNVLYALFPMVLVVKIRQLSSITSNLMKDVLAFIENNPKSRVDYMELQIRQECKMANIEQKWKEYRFRFKALGFGSNIGIEEVSNVHCIQIKKYRLERNS